MSTYLVGIVVGELEASHMLVDVAYDGAEQGSGRNKLPVTVYNRIGYGSYVDLAKHAAAAAVEGMELLPQNLLLPCMAHARLAF